eukprot:Hpha_TRINITY_DN30260_c0_g1::TRINITY_DN30260_c0_g1_i1::g.27111::m.27111
MSDSESFDAAPRVRAANAAGLRRAADPLERGEGRHTVQFGDLLTLYFHELHGWMSGDGGGIVRVDSLEHDVGVPPNLRDCVFEIIPQRRCAASKALRRAALAATDRSGRVAKHDMISLLRRQVAEEERGNGEAEEAAVGGDIVYGSVVQLRHHSTRSYLTRLKSMSLTDRDNRRVTLATDGDEGAWWQIVSVFRYRREGEPVSFDDPVYFVTPGASGGGGQGAA